MRGGEGHGDDGDRQVQTRIAIFTSLPLILIHLNPHSFDKDNINPATIKSIAVYIDNPEFMPEKIKSVSSAAYGLCSWVSGNVALRGVYSLDRCLVRLDGLTK